jgi:DNA polymerase zeta
MVADDLATDRLTSSMDGFKLSICESEERMFEQLLDFVLDLDPDILTGYEVHSSSWGYLIERAAKAYRMDLCERLSRIQASDGAVATRNAPENEEDEEMAPPVSREKDQWGYQKTSIVSVTGRIVLNTWRLMRSELDLTSYTMENMVWHVLHRRTPKFNYRTLTTWYTSCVKERLRVVKYFSDRAKFSLELLDECNIIGRTRYVDTFE